MFADDQMDILSTGTVLNKDQLKKVRILYGCLLKIYYI